VVHFAVCGFLVYITTSANAASNGGKSVCDIKQLEVSIGALQNPEWKVRSEAYYRIITLGSEDLSYIPRPLTQLLSICQDRADAIKISLIRLLERENLMVQDYHRTGRRFGEEYSNYYGDVISAVSSLKDKRAINALLGAISSGGMATRGLADLAPESLEPVLTKLNDNDPLVRSCALLVLEEMVARVNQDKLKDGFNRSKIKAAALKAATDEDPVVRKSAVSVLAELGDADVMSVIEKLADHDPFFLAGQAEGGKDLYIVRKAAREALAELRSKRKQPK
jgi:HEAT repeat protein